MECTHHLPVTLCYSSHREAAAAMLPYPAPASASTLLSAPSRPIIESLRCSAHTVPTLPAAVTKAAGTRCQGRKLQQSHQCIGGNCRLIPAANWNQKQRLWADTARSASPQRLSCCTETRVSICWRHRHGLLTDTEQLSTPAVLLVQQHKSLND